MGHLGRGDGYLRADEGKGERGGVEEASVAVEGHLEREKEGAEETEVEYAGIEEGMRREKRVRILCNETKVTQRNTYMQKYKT